MSVYKEGFAIVEMMMNEEIDGIRISDGFTKGVLVNKGDKFWNGMKQLKEWYGRSEINPDLRVIVKKEMGMCAFEFELCDEWSTGEVFTGVIVYFSKRFYGRHENATRGHDGVLVLNDNIKEFMNRVWIRDKRKRGV